MTLKINEIFYSIQGEGVLTGAPTIFIRTTGCNLRCRWCDTEYAFYEGEEMEIEEILERIKGLSSETGCRRVCLTGGEPLIQGDAQNLSRRILEAGYHLTLETNGSIPLSPFIRGIQNMQRKNLLISMDIKCPSSGEEGKMRFDNIPLLTPMDQLKFVVLDRKDLSYAFDVIRGYKIACPVIIQPVFSDDRPAQEIAGLAEAFLHTLPPGDIRFMLQIHKFIWGNRKGT